MFRAIVRTQWKWSRLIVLFATIAAFAIPLLSLQTALAGQAASAYLEAMMAWSIAYTIAAAGIGLALATLAWSSDHRGRHVYALMLPIPRWQYALMRLGAGALFIIPPVVAVLISGELVAHSGNVPVGLHAYPVAVAARFALASLVAFTMFFAINAATPRTAGYVLGAIATVIVIQLLLEAAHLQITLLPHLADFVFAGPGAFAVFNGRWMLIDV